jgi:serine/threonine-protein kinase
MLDLDRWNEIKAIVQEALDRPAQERVAYLNEACSSDPILRQEVEALLAVSETNADFFDHYQVLPPSLERAHIAEDTLIGPYKIVRPLGEGGMGAVYLAQDMRVDRLIALKTVPRRSGHALAKEQQLLARLQHPAIAALYDTGTTQDGFGYFVMEYVDGEPITAYCERHQLSLRERLSLFLSVCDAVSFAHRQLVVHRDIKPSNILVTQDRKPKLLDFGIAKQLSIEAHDATLTRPENRPLTIAFASPEQLEGEPTSTATDVYSLGTLLCVLLTGKLPYPVKSHRDLPWAIRNLEPEKPSELLARHPSPLDFHVDQLSSSAVDTATTRRAARLLRGDLDTIVLKALRKEPEKRYQTVVQLAADITHFLNNEPVSAHKGSQWYLARKFWQRRRRLVLAACSVFVAFILLSFSLFIQYREATRQRDLARIQQRRSESITSFLLKIFDLSSPFSRGADKLSVRELLDRAASESEKSLRQYPAEQVSIQSHLAYIYNDYGLHDKAEMMAQTALNHGLSQLPRNSPSLGDAYFSLATTQLAASDYRASERLHRKALDIRRQALGENHPDYLTSLYGLGLALYNQGKIEEAEISLRESLYRQQKLTPPRQEDVIRSTTALALLLERSQRYKEAEHLYSEALQLAEIYFGPYHPSVASILDNYAQLMTNTGRFAEAEKLHRQALQITRQSLGENHPNIVDRLHNLSFVLTFRNKDAKAEAFEREALERSRTLLGREHEYSFVISGALARLLAKQKKFHEALTLLSNAKREARASHGEKHRLVTRLERHTAHVLYESGDLPAAEEAARRVLERLAIDPTSNPQEVAATKSLLADCLIARRNFGEAEKLALEWFNAAPPREQFDAVYQLARIYEGWGKLERAAEYRKRLTYLKEKWEAEQSKRQ